MGVLDQHVLNPIVSIWVNGSPTLASTNTGSSTILSWNTVSVTGSTAPSTFKVLSVVDWGEYDYDGNWQWYTSSSTVATTSANSYSYSWPRVPRDCTLTGPGDQVEHITVVQSVQGIKSASSNEVCF